MTTEPKDTLKRKRAAFAYEWVRTWQGKPWETRVAALIKSLPVALRTQGLSLTLATLVSKDPKKQKELDEKKELARFLAAWLLRDAPHKPLPGQRGTGTPDPMELLESCIQADRTSYLAAQYEALMLMEELKVMAQALMKEQSA